MLWRDPGFKVGDVIEICSPKQMGISGAKDIDISASANGKHMPLAEFIGTRGIITAEPTGITGFYHVMLLGGVDAILISDEMKAI